MAIAANRKSLQDRQRALVAEAFSAITEYREYPYIVYRRDKLKKEEERTRISSALSTLQSRINSLQAQLFVETPFIADSYKSLVAATRKIAGPAIKMAWDSEPAGCDAEVSTSAYDTTQLEKPAQRFLKQARRNFGWVPNWVYFLCD
ncbi:MAG: hypothetical protein ACE37K_06295 [Planctomycetota bacterium]